MEADENPFPEPVPIPVTGELDLHTFQPSELGTLLPEYLEQCRRQGLLRVRVVHGKGTGALREGVHALLRRSPLVASFTPAGELEGGWGATLVHLRPS
jgi:DNA-nicking Smr family endonuclease